VVLKDETMERLRQEVVRNCDVTRMLQQVRDATLMVLFCSRSPFRVSIALRALSALR